MHVKDTHLFLLFLLVMFTASCSVDSPVVAHNGPYPVHDGIITTVFWVGEAADVENAYIPNNMSSWDTRWQEHYGGYDDPDNRNGYYPASFVPKENPFYFALPYNDFDEHGRRRANAFDVVYWAHEADWESTQSMLKNRWIAVAYEGRTAYAQWQDTGPWVYDDADYVFGTATPRYTDNNGAALDVSPAVRDFLGIGDIARTSWWFVDPEDVPDGPWSETVTTSGVCWQ